MIEGIDFAWGSVTPAQLKAAGKHFVCRYVSTVGNTKNIRPSEVQAYKANGIGIVIVFETTASRALGGFIDGRSDALSALRQVVAAGGPHDAVIYFAVDFDATQAQQVAINRYLQGAASVLGKMQTGVYGGYWVVKRALDAKVCTYAWQTYAWSGGQWDPRAHIQQYSNGHQIGGANCDLDRATKADYGQWWRQAPPNPAPKSDVLPGPNPKPKWFWLALKQFLANRRGAH